MDLSDLTFLDGRVIFPDGTGADGGVQPDCFGAGRGGITVQGPLSYFGGGTQDIFKISSQLAGSGAVILACNAAVTDYEPLQFRGETVGGNYRIPDPANPTGPSTMHAAGFLLNTSGHFEVFNDFIPHGAIDFSENSGPYIRGNAAHGVRINDSANAINIAIFYDDGRVRIPALAGSGTRTLKVDSSGYLCV